MLAFPPLGWGQDGAVWRTDAKTAIKVFLRETNYHRELSCYYRLAEHNIREIDGFEIPIFLNSDDHRMVIEMGIVRAPYILDFGKAYLDEEPPYGLDALNESRELWEDDQWPVVESILWQLRKIGIYYTDPNPRNIDFGGG